MHALEMERWRHPHAFGAAEHAAGERRTRWVVALTLAMMAGEIAAGTALGSMALLADGWHMATHAAALGLAAFAYFYARRHAVDPRYSFGTGKVSALGSFGSAIGLALVALLVLVQSAVRLASPVAIHFDEAIAVASIGLVVNLVSAVLLRDDHEGQGQPRDAGHDHDRDHDQGSGATVHHRDHNLRGAYLHVMADAVTSVLAIVALLAGKYLGWAWMDAAMGMVGSLVIGRWSYGLLRETTAVLLDAEVPAQRRRVIQAALESDEDVRVADLHLWRIGPRHLAGIISLVTHQPRDPDFYKERLRGFRDLAHVTVEVHRCVAADRQPDNCRTAPAGSPA